MNRRSTWKRRIARRLVLYGVMPYLLLVVLFAFMQRWLIYLPSKKATITTKEARLLPGTVQGIEVETDDGLTLNGWHFLSDGRKVDGRADADRVLGEGRKLVLFFHGNGGDRRDRKFDGRDLAELGLDVFLFDYRGYGDNAGSPSEERLAADARSIWNYATQTRDVSPDRILLYGESLGGGVAVRLAAELCETGAPPAALILCSTFSSLTDAGAWHYPWLPVRWLLLDRYPSASRIASVTCPVLQVHGQMDEVVPIDLGRRLHSAIPKQSADGIAKRFLEISDVGHNDLSVTYFREAIRTLLDQLAMM